jgi:hypothetical protein
MAYKVDKFNGQTLTNVADGTVDSTTDLRFVGKNYAGYGEIQNENFLHLMENFSNSTPPPKAITGQVWYDSGNQKLKFYNGSRFKTANGAETGSSQPSGLAIGEFWWNTSTKQLYVWSGTQFELVGPETSPDLGETSVSIRAVKDNLDGDHVIVEIIAGGKVVSVVSQNTFTLKGDDALATDFPRIQKGITLINTGGTGVTSDDHRFWGTASNSDKLGGINASEFIDFIEGNFNNEVGFSDLGFKVGDDNDLHIRIDNADQPIIESKLGANITFRITPLVGSASEIALKTTGIIPTITNTLNLGSSSERWNSVWAQSVTANSFTGNLVGNTTGIHTGNLRASTNELLVDTTITSQYTGTVGNSDGKTLIRGIHVGTFVGNVTGSSGNSTTVGGYSPSESATATTLALRTSNGSLVATSFIGVSTQADTLNVSGSYRSADTAATANTIAARNSAGDLYAVLFQGTATAARYADLAEKYLADKDYDVGTVMSVGGSAEVTSSSAGDNAIGVTSSNPAFMMNKDLEGGIYVALKGRVPCKVAGPVKKGQRLIAGDDGVAVAVNTKTSDVFAISMETNDSDDVKLIEVVVL